MTCIPNAVPMTLQKMHVPSRLIVYSDAGHWPSWYEMALYYTAHLEWFHQYLGGGAPPWSTEAFLRNAVFDTTTGKRIEPEKAPENPQGKPDVKPQPRGVSPLPRPSGQPS